MSVYADIIAWSHNLPLWQRDALRRLATQVTLTSADIDELALACLAEANQRPAVPASVPMDSSHVPSNTGSGSAVTITGISDCSCLNAIRDGQSLTFGADALTIVYGDNGAGKSGFVRVLRSSCQARGSGPEVLSNVFADQPGCPGACVQYRVNGSERVFRWTKGGGAAPDELRAVSIFDSAAAAALIEQENEVLWTPGGLDLLVRLANVVDEVRKQLRQRLDAIPSPGALPKVPDGTTAFDFLARLSPSTTTASIDAFALSPDEQEELRLLDATLSAPEPAVEATRLNQQAQRFRALRDRVAQLEQGLGRGALQELEDLRATYKEAVDAERLLADQVLADSLVPGVGDRPWRALWDAAERYAAEGATADRLFPSEISPALCILCQQPLAETALARLKRFREFVRDETAKKRTQAADALRRKLQGARNLRAKEAADEAILGELDGIDPENAQNQRRFLDAASIVISAIGGLAPESKEWRLPEPLPSGLAAWLDTVIANNEGRAEAMSAAADPAQQERNHERSNELRSRQALFAGRAAVVAEVRRLSDKAALECAIAPCVTTGITRKAGELTRVHVSERLMAAFDAEARKIRLPVTVNYSHSHNEKGSSYQKIVLRASSWAERVGVPTVVLSEGERRGVALAAFLAELATRGDRSCVVFDDPVSSLDHVRRHKVADRLVALASERQVIVFTHDLVFLHMLKTAANETGIAVTDREVRRAREACGICRDKPPIKAMRIRALVGELKERQQHCAALYRNGQQDEYEAQLTNTFGLLREAWESAVEELLLNQTVMRFDHRVQTQRLKNLYDITQEDIDAIDAGMSVCSKWLPGHAQASAINEPLPEPDVLLKEIERLERFAQEMRKRGRQ